MPGISLYKISDEYEFLLKNLYDADTGEIQEGFLARLNEIEGEMQNKCINLVRFMKGIEAEYKAVETERKAMQERERKLKKHAEWLETYLKENMEKSEIKEISCPQFVIKLRKNPQSVEVYSELAIDPKYHKITTTFNIQQIKDDLKDGIKVHGARLVQTNSVSIK